MIQEKEIKELQKSLKNHLKTTAGEEQMQRIADSAETLYDLQGSYNQEKTTNKKSKLEKAEKSFRNKVTVLFAKLDCKSLPKSLQQAIQSFPREYAKTEKKQEIASWLINLIQTSIAGANKIIDVLCDEIKKQLINDYIAYEYQGITKESLSLYISQPKILNAVLNGVMQAAVHEVETIFKKDHLGSSLFYDHLFHLVRSKTMAKNDQQATEEAKFNFCSMEEVLSCVQEAQEYAKIPSQLEFAPIKPPEKFLGTSFFMKKIDKPQELETRKEKSRHVVVTDRVTELKPKKGTIELKKEDVEKAAIIIVGDQKGIIEGHELEEEQKFKRTK